MIARETPWSAPLDAVTPWVGHAVSYWIDAAQRTALFWDLMRRRGAQYERNNAAGNPPVLSFEYTLILDGRTLPRPTNYQLLQIVPPEGTTVDPTRRPYVIIDPRAGQGAGIGGSQTDSQVGVALRAGHPCYFVSFSPVPEPEQTIEDITAAEVAFLEEVRRRHPDAQGEPVLIGNCQAGWAVILLSGANPDKVGPLVLAGTPLAYWDGPKGASPMRYFGGLMGGSWLGELASDVGHGRFDGAYLVQNFENLKPGKTLFDKQYRAYARIDEDAERFLEFERWWSGFFLMNAEEMRFITNELFIGNKLARGELVSPHGHRIDLRNIKSPIVVLTSHGDDITPPAQALNWILDLYDSVEDIRSAGQTIVYCIHPDVGHLGIFVSGRLAEREHAEFIENIDLIELLPPGLYEAVITEIPEGQRGSRYVEGKYATRFKARTLDDLRKIGGRSEANTKRFEAVARLSEINLGLYRQFWQPVVQAVSNEPCAEAVRQAQPARLRYSLWTDANPWFRMWSGAVEAMADLAREHRRPVDEHNPFWRAQELWADSVVRTLDAYRDVRDRGLEIWFEAVFGNALVQSMLGMGASSAEAARGPSKAYVFAHLEDQRRRHHDELIHHGGLPEAVLRGGMYVMMGDHSVDERAYNAFKHSFEPLRAETAVDSTPAVRQMVREQHALLLDRPEEALRALPELVPDPKDRAHAFAVIREIVSARGPLDPRRVARLEEVRALLGVEGASSE